MVIDFKKSRIEKVIEFLVSKGADQSLFELPAVKERLKRLVGKIDGVLEEELLKEGYTEIDQNGNFRIGELQISRADKEGSNVFLRIRDHEYNVSDAQSGQETAYEHYSVITDIQSDVIVDENGMEIEGDYIDNGYDTYRSMVLGYEDEKKHTVRHIKRCNGIIEDSRNASGDTYYDVCNWELSQSGSAHYPTYGSDAIEEHKRNTQYLTQNYPRLAQYCIESERLLIGQLEHDEIEKLKKENSELRNNNQKLQKMLQKALTFVQTVRDSRVGGLLYGKKAKEVLGEQDKDTKQLPEGK